MSAPRRGSPAHEIVRATAAVARAQAGWIAAMEPWRGLGYEAPALGRYLARVAGQAPPGGVWVARPKGGKGAPVGIIAATDGFLLGGFIGLLAVRAEASGRGLGAELVAAVEHQLFDRRRWLFVSCDADNRAALRFYGRLGFLRVGRLPDLVASGRVEILLRKSAGSARIPGGKISVGEHPARVPWAGK